MDLDAPASDSDADVGCPMPLGFPLHGNCEQASHKARGGTPRSTLWQPQVARVVPARTLWHPNDQITLQWEPHGQSATQA